MKKTDNHNARAKLDLRRKLLDNKESWIKVLDCFSGSEECIWSTLRKELNVVEYLALDVKHKRNRLKIDSLKFLKTQKWIFDVIDLDAYGSPWDHYFEVLKTDRQHSMIVFVTVGTSMLGNLSKTALQAIGVPSNTPTGMHRQLSELAVSYCLSRSYELGWNIDKAFEALNPGGNARYIGIKLTKTSQWQKKQK